MDDLQREGSRQELIVRWNNSGVSAGSNLQIGVGLGAEATLNNAASAKSLPFRGMNISPTIIADGNHQYVFGDVDASAAQPALDAVRAAGGEIISLIPMHQRLEELFMKIVIDPATGKAPPPGAGS
jgi:hypothetical protein